MNLIILNINSDICKANMDKKNLRVIHNINVVIMLQGTLNILLSISNMKFLHGNVVV